MFLKNKYFKHSKVHSGKHIYLLLTLMMISCFSIFPGKMVEASTAVKTMTIVIPESTTSSASKVVNIPNLKSVVGVTANTGTTSYSISGNNITLSVSGGSYSRTTTTNKTTLTSTTDTYWIIKSGTATTYPSASDFPSYTSWSISSSKYCGSPLYWDFNDTSLSGSIGSLTYSFNSVSGLCESYAPYYALCYGYKTEVSTKYYYNYIFTINYIDNSEPTISVTSPFQNETLSEVNNCVPSITVADPDGDVLTCKYYIDSVVKETKTALNTTKSQPITFNTLNTSTLSEGSHTLRFEVSDGINTPMSKTVDIMVYRLPPAPTGVTLDKATMILTSIGKTGTLTATVVPSNATNKTVTWSSSDTSVVTVSSTGVVTAIAQGTATITGTTQQGSKTATCVVTVLNSKPIFAQINNKLVYERQQLIFTVDATDVDGDALTYSTDKLPEGAVFDSLTRTFTWTPTYVQAGEYTVKFNVSDGVNVASKNMTITVNDVNTIPILNPIGSKSVDEAQKLTFTIGGSDVDGDALTYSTNTLPEGAVFNSLTRTFTWTPTYAQAGEYTVRFSVSDGVNIQSEYVTITVNDINTAPILNPIGSKSVDEAQKLTFTIGGSDVDGDALTYSTDNLPEGAVFDSLTRTFTWTPTYAQAGEYTVKFNVSDGVNLESEDITITVNDINTAPILNPIGSKSVDEAQKLTFTIGGSDVDGDALTYSTDNLPEGAVFDSLTRTFTWTPTYVQAGEYTVKFNVSDGVNVASENMTITVNDVNTIPILNPIGSKSVDEAQKLTFTIGGSDVDGDALTYSTDNLPEGVVFDSLTRTFTWTPTYAQAGEYTVKFNVSDGVNVASENITITVNDVSVRNTIDYVIKLIDDLNLTNNSLISTINNVVKALDKGNENAALNGLNATINKIEAMREKKLTNAQADELIAAIHNVIDNINS